MDQHEDRQAEETEHTGTTTPAGSPTLEQSMEALVLLEVWRILSSREMMEADDWVMDYFAARSLEESRAKYPRGSEEAYRRDKVASFWELCGVLASSGLVNTERFINAFGGHPRTRWRVYEPMFRSARHEPGRPEARRRAAHFEWLAAMCERQTREQAKLAEQATGDEAATATE
ncbi:MAG TPA: hypothetical protein VIL37_19835 [Natronosporangium sp.]